MPATKKWIAAAAMTGAVLTGVVGTMMLLPDEEESAAVAAAVDFDSLRGKWQIAYGDAELGTVTGTAVIDSDGGIDVQLEHPATGEIHTLRATTISGTPEDLTVVLDGRSPRSIRQDGKGYPDLDVELPLKAATISLRTESGASLSISVAPRRESDLDRVELRLKIIDQETLSGTWRYRADPVTARDRDGYGRSGTFVEDEEGSTWQEGWEVWSRPKPLIEHSFVVEDQLALGTTMKDGTREGHKPAYPHPFQDNENRGSATTRSVYIAGKNLPQSREDGIVEIEPLTPHVRYSVRLPGDHFQLPEPINPLVRGRDLLQERLDTPEDKEAARKLDDLWVQVTLEEGVLPGDHIFLLNGIEVGWTLQFGDNRAAVSFVRPVDPGLPHNRGAFASTWELFVTETVRVQVTTALDLGVDSIDLTLAEGVSMLKFGNSPIVKAYRSTEDRRVFRTRPILLEKRVSGSFDTRVEPADGEERLVVPVSRHSRISAQITEDGLISILPPALTIHLHISPDSVAWRDESYLWKDAILEASRCHGIQLEGWDTQDYQKADSVNRYLIWPAWWIKWQDLEHGEVGYADMIKHFRERGILSVDFQLGDHAAMILLRRAFIDLMVDATLQLSVDSDKAMKAFWLANSPLMRPELSETELWNIEVAGPEGTIRFFWQTYEIEEEFLQRPDPEKVPAWVAGPTRKFIIAYRKKVHDTFGSALAVDPCDVEELVELTGDGFEPVVEFLQSMLVTLRESPNRSALSFVADEQARHWVYGVAEKYEVVRSIGKLAKADNEYLLTFFLGSAGAIGAPFGPAVAWTVTFIDAGINGAVALSELHQSQQRIDFAIGAMDIIGYARFGRAKAEEVTVMNVVSSVTSSVMLDQAIGNVLELGGLLKVAGTDLASGASNQLRRWRIRKGHEALEAVDFDLSRVPSDPRTLARVGEYVAHAANIRSRNRILDDDQIRVLSSFDALPQKTHAEATAWTRNVDPSIRAEIDEIAMRPDVRKLARTDEPALVGFLNNPSTRRDAVDVLRHNPVESIQDLHQSIKRRETIRREYGEEYYAQADAEHLSAELLEENHWRFRTNEKGDGGLEITVSDPNGRRGRIVVAFDPATGTYRVRSETWMTGRVREEIDSHLPVRPGDSGVPTDEFMHMRALRTVDVGYRGGGMPLRAIRLEKVLDPDTVAHLEWYRAANHPSKTLDELAESGDLGRAARNSEAVLQAERLLSRLGYEIDEVIVHLDGSFEVPSVLAAQKGRYGGGKDLNARWVQVRYGLTSRNTSRAGMDIEIRVRPKTGAPDGPAFGIDRDAPTGSIPPGVDASYERAAFRKNLEELGIDETSANDLWRDLVEFKGVPPQEALVVGAIRRGRDPADIERVTGFPPERIQKIIDEEFQRQGIRDPAERAELIDRYFEEHGSGGGLTPASGGVAESWQDGLTPRPPGWETPAPGGREIPDSPPPPVAAFDSDEFGTVLNPGRRGDGGQAPETPAPARQTNPDPDSLRDRIRQLQGEAETRLREGHVEAGVELEELQMRERSFESLDVESQRRAARAVELMQDLGVDEQNAIGYAVLHARRRWIRDDLSGDLARVTSVQLATEGFLFFGGRRILPMSRYLEVTGLSHSSALRVLEEAGRRYQIGIVPGEVRTIASFPPESY